MFGTLLGLKGSGARRLSSAASLRGPASLRSLGVEALEARNLLSVSAVLNNGVLSITADPTVTSNNIRVLLDPTTNSLVVRSFADNLASFSSAAVTTIVIQGGTGSNILAIDHNVTQQAFIFGGNGLNELRGGGGPATLVGGPDINKILVGPAPSVIDGGPGLSRIFGVKPTDTVVPEANEEISFALPGDPDPPAPTDANTTLSASDVNALLQRASAADPSQNAIIAIMDRGGRVLGVRVENGVSPLITTNSEKLVFAIDGALALARTGAFFGNDQAPLTSRTIQDISQSTHTQREIQSDPNIPDPNSTLRGPGFVAPIGLKDHFPPGVQYTPQVDLFDIEASNRDSIISPGPNRIRQVVIGPGGTPMPAPGSDDIALPARFNIDPAFYNPAIIAAADQLVAPDSFGLLSGLLPSGQSRGIGTLPGGIPIYKNGIEVGGIGVFYPGTTGFATEENSILDETFDPTKPDLSNRAEAVAFAAVGGVPGSPFSLPGPIGGVALPPGIGISLPAPGRIDLVGITLDVFGPHGNEGPPAVAGIVAANGQHAPDGVNLPVPTYTAGIPTASIANPTAFNNLLATQGLAAAVASLPAGTNTANGVQVPDGWIVVPHDGVGITAAQVEQIVAQGIQQANQTRAAIRLPQGDTTRMIFAVADQNGNLVGLFRMPDATVFSLDVAVAKSRNVAYYNNPAQLQPIDQIPGVVPGMALTARSFRFLALPRFPEGIDGTLPGPFSILNDGGVLVPSESALNFGPPLPASAFQSAQGFNDFNPQSNFHDPFNVANQNGIIFFPGSSGVYLNHSVLIGGFGVSGDGVDQDDVVTTNGIIGFEPPDVARIDQVLIRGVRVPYNKFDRNPEEL
jgi:uncharacterized protein GlcG (DUF336 family)